MHSTVHPVLYELWTLFQHYNQSRLHVAFRSGLRDVQYEILMIQLFKSRGKVDVRFDFSVDLASIIQS